MPATEQNQLLVLSQKLYVRLLKVYPQAHRELYGDAIVQLFRDQCRDAWRESHSWGLVKLWLRVLPDLVKTSISEHLHELKGKKPMFEKTFGAFHLDTTPLKAFFTVFVIVVVLVFSVAAVGTFLLPDSYAGTARIKLEATAIHAKGRDGSPIIVSGYDPHLLQREFEVIESETVLNRVIEELNLQSAWGKKYAAGTRLADSQTLELLRNRLTLRPVRNTGLIEIRVFSEDRVEAASIANLIAEVYAYRANRQKSVPHSPRVEISDRAEPGLRPVRPNRPLNLALGASGGMLLGLAIGGVAALIARLKVGSSREPAPLHSSIETSIQQSSSAQRPTLSDRIFGGLWLAIGAVLSGIILFFMFTELPKLAEFKLTPDILLAILFAVFWGVTAVIALFLSQGKSWARYYIGALGVLLTWYFVLTLHVPGPPSMRWGGATLGLVTAIATFWPRRKNAAKAG